MSLGSITEKIAEVSNWDDEDPVSGHIQPENLQQAKSTEAGPLSMLGAGNRDLFRTHPVSRHSLRSDELFHFGKSR